MRATRTSSSRSGFTVTELLVTMGIIAVLAALVLAAVARVRRSAGTAKCVANLQQIALAVQMYDQKYRQPVLPDETGLRGALAEFLSTDEIFRCPLAPPGERDSYSKYYLPRTPGIPNTFLILCPNHGDDIRTIALSGTGRVRVCETASVVWNGEKVRIGATVTGGELEFADGTTVDIEDDLNVVVLGSFQEADASIYSAIRIPTGAFGSIDVHAADGTHFDVSTPACTAGVRGTEFKVTTAESSSGSKALFVTEIEVHEGSVGVETFWPKGGFEILTGDRFSAARYELPAGAPPVFADLVLDAFRFKDRDLKCDVTNQGDEAVTIGRLILHWPASNGRLEEVKLDGKKIYDVNVAPPDADISSGWSGDTKHRTLSAGETKELKLHFRNRADRSIDAYRIILLPK